MTQITVEKVGGVWCVFLQGTAAVRCESKAEAEQMATTLREREIKQNARRIP